jgi:coproporphyrinogen III oxidase-like Fe-S oxidoreductase
MQMKPNSPIPERFKFNPRLSAVQKEVLLLLLDKKYAAMPRRTFTRDVILRQHFGIDSSCYPKSARRFPSDSTNASLSRSYRRLEANGLIIRADGCWRLTQHGEWFASRVYFERYEQKVKEKQAAAIKEKA